MTTDIDYATYQVERDAQCAQMARLKAYLKTQKITNAEIARWCGCSASNISAILNGNWPHYCGGSAPMYFERVMAVHITRAQDVQKEETI